MQELGEGWFNGQPHREKFWFWSLRDCRKWPFQCVNYENIQWMLLMKRELMAKKCRWDFSFGHFGIGKWRTLNRTSANMDDLLLIRHSILPEPRILLVHKGVYFVQDLFLRLSQSYHIKKICPQYMCRIFVWYPKSIWTLNKKYFYSGKTKKKNITNTIDMNIKELLLKSIQFHFYQIVSNKIYRFVHS